jgi:FkbM family methyltransferase
MNIQKRVQFIFLHVQKIGFLTTIGYFVQRVIKAKNDLIVLKLNGLPHKVFLRNKTFDVHIFYQIFIKEDLYFNYGKDISTIFDCGANIGLASLYYYRTYKNAKIIAIEPESRNFELLIKNIANYEIIIPIKTAVFGEDCDLTLVDIGGGEASYRVMNVAEQGDVLQTISCRSIDSLMKELHLNKIDILKMDIEGSEKECLFSPHIKWLEKTKYFLLEIHENIHPGIIKAIYDLIPATSKFFFNGEYTFIENI